jgi:hypothetical protein
MFSQVYIETMNQSNSFESMRKNKEHFIKTVPPLEISKINIQSLKIVKPDYRIKQIPIIKLFPNKVL